MSSLIKLANKFKHIIKQADPLKDPLLKNDVIEPEMTEEMDEIVKDCFHLVILLQRAFVDFEKRCQENFGETKELGTKLSHRVMEELTEIEDKLHDSSLLNFDLNYETSTLESIDQDIYMINAVMNLASGTPVLKELNQSVHKWLHQLQENVDKLNDLARKQSEYLETYHATQPTRMIEQDLRTPDEIAPWEIHPDYDDGPEHFSGDALDNESDILDKLDEKYPSDTKGRNEYGEFYNDLKKEKERREWASGKRHK